MSEAQEKDPKTNIQSVVKDIINNIEQEREQEIINRRFGLNDRRETLEQIGELLGITRERVRQLEKAILGRLKSASNDSKIKSLSAYEKVIIRTLSEMGRVARVTDLADLLFGKKTNTKEQSQIAFIATLSPSLTVVDENDDYFHSVGILEYGDSKKIKNDINSIVSIIKKHGEPLTIEQLHNEMSFEHPSHVEALASISKSLAQLKGNWGLQKWPTVNPRNIRDKIFVVLAEQKKPMHFSEISKSIKNSSFKRKDVTTQAIHNELIKDPRFVLIGRGIYALNSWGFTRGTVSDIIGKVLKDSPIPLHRDEIVRRVLKSRHVKTTTVLLNLQSKPQFKRVAKATYTFDSTAK